MAKYLDEILDNVFDSRDLIERMDEIESEFTNDDGDVKITDPDIQEEYAEIKEILEEIGEDAESGVSLISENYFENYAREFAADIGAINEDAAWPASYIDWKAAADALKMDFMSIDIQGTTYWYQ